MNYSPRRCEWHRCSHVTLDKKVNKRVSQNAKLFLHLRFLFWTEFICTLQFFRLAYDHIVILHIYRKIFHMYVCVRVHLPIEGLLPMFLGLTESLMRSISCS